MWVAFASGTALADGAPVAAWLGTLIAAATLPVYVATVLQSGRGRRSRDVSNVIATVGAGIGLALVGTVTAGGSTLPAVYAWASLFAVLTYVRLCLPTQRYRSAQSLGSDTQSIGAYARAQRIPAAYAPDAIGQPWMAPNPPVATTIRAQA
jgi:hypothetical protein